MKTKNLLLVGLTVIAVGGVVPRAVAGGVSFGISIGVGIPAPVAVYAPAPVYAPVVVTPPVVCASPVVYRAPVVYPPPVVFRPPAVCARPVIYHRPVRVVPRGTPVLYKKGPAHPPGHYPHQKNKHGHRR